MRTNLSWCTPVVVAVSFTACATDQVVVPTDARLAGMPVVVPAGATILRVSPNHPDNQHVGERRVANRFAPNPTMNSPLANNEDPPPGTDAILTYFAEAQTAEWRADASGGAYTNAGIAWVSAASDVWYYPDLAIPTHDQWDCARFNACTWAWDYGAECDVGDYKLSVYTDADAHWLTAWANSDEKGPAHKQDMCGPGNTGGGYGGGDPGGGGTGDWHCDTYIVERSDDNGQTWYVVEVLSTC
ncbi:MAG TPA: hypothetical protein VKH19_10540 [Gemmatimonadaceae bacterium]|nr:hypothetical protein [Gemmatimonadaceae bacterium]